MEQKLKTIKTIHLAIVLGICVGYYVIGDFKSLEQLTQIPKITKGSVIYALIPLVAVILSSVLFRLQIQKIDTNLPLEDKIAPYQAAAIVRFAILEGTCFLILILQRDFALLGIILIIYILLLRPTENKIKSDLKHIG
ncbi:MFS transporter [Wenyingzhuangia aestuarii]|uniref:MFS transporter n=1 Tax=Wenyingzhuangia aestuarii TaxID=1647582 RepID=UPI0014387FF1|nr:MFS transporter [Wenyingzhuangia aestuarii]NJB83077.1 fructose-specific phosphotransferase system IIC component [Wenyingzhuangia aestuarii]